MNVDYLLERRNSMKRLEKYKFAFMFLCFFFVAYYIYNSKQENQLMPTDYIAQIKIKGFISNNEYDAEKIENLINDANVKAVILIIDTYGGNIAENEKLYTMLRRLAIEKPMIAKIESMAYSGGYLIALAADYIVAIHNSTIGSITNIIHNSEIEDFSRIISINPNVYIQNQATPQEITMSDQAITEAREKKINDQTKQQINSFISNIASYYKKIISERRGIAIDQLDEIANGIAYTGAQARDLKLIDEVTYMTDDSIKLWLQEKKNISKDLTIKQINLISNNKEDNVTDLLKRLILLLDKVTKFI